MRLQAGQWKIRSVNDACRRSFSQLVADSQYASLGIVLLAALASIQQAMGVGEVLGTVYSSKVQKPSHVTGLRVNEDRGQHIKRAVLIGAKAKPSIENTAGSVRQSHTSTNIYHGAKPTLQARRKISNVIDDLFDGF